MKGISNQILVTWVILLNLSVSSAAFGQTPEEARKDLEKLKFSWSNEEFITRAKRGDSDILKLFLIAGMKPDTKDADGRTALIWASLNGRIAAVKNLLDFGADVNTVDNKGISALMEASSAGMTEIVRLLIEKGANVNSSARDGMTPLMLASAQGHAGIFNILTDKGANISAANRDGRTALILAAANGHTEVVKALLEKGADMDVTDNAGFTALMWAETNKHTAVVRLFKKAMKVEVYSTPSQTLTNPQLQRDVSDHIMQLELASDEKCQEHSIISTEIVEYPSRIGISKWAERWRVDRCGQSISYRVEFRPDEKGGAYFKVLEEGERVPVGEMGPGGY